MIQSHIMGWGNSVFIFFNVNSISSRNGEFKASFDSETKIDRIRNPGINCTGLLIPVLIYSCISHNPLFDSHGINIGTVFFFFSRYSDLSQNNFHCSKFKTTFTVNKAWTKTQIGNREPGCQCYPFSQTFTVTKGLLILTVIIDTHKSEIENDHQNDRERPSDQQIDREERITQIRKQEL